MWLVLSWMRFWSELDKYKLLGTPFAIINHAQGGAPFNEVVYEKERST